MRQTRLVIQSCCLLILLLVLSHCSSPEQKLRKRHLKGDYIYRLQGEFFFQPPSPHLTPREKYPWEDKYVGEYPRITKEFFRCKGNPMHPVVIKEREGKEALYYRDCPGGRCHGLPLREDKEFVYPCLLDILNYIQQKTEKKVVITCGHRCPTHNAYSDPSSYNWGSKHMLGAEVDFYVLGMEEEPLALVELIQNYYRETSEDPAYTNFQRYTKEGLNVSTAPWYNKEIFVKLYTPEEGRDFDNRHPYPYLGVQVRYDRELNQRVVFESAQSQNYLRH